MGCNGMGGSICGAIRARDLQRDQHKGLRCDEAEGPCCDQIVVVVVWSGGSMRCEGLHSRQWGLRGGIAMRLGGLQCDGAAGLQCHEGMQRDRCKGWRCGRVVPMWSGGRNVGRVVAI